MREVRSENLVLNESRAGELAHGTCDNLFYAAPWMDSSKNSSKVVLRFAKHFTQEEGIQAPRPVNDINVCMCPSSQQLACTVLGRLYEV